MTVNDSVPWRGVEIKWLAHADIGAQFGAALLVNVPAGAAYEVHRHREVERVVYVLAGSGKHRGSGGTVAVVRDDALVLSPGTWHGFENDRGSAARLVILYAPHTRFPHHDYECTDPEADLGGEITVHKLHDIPERPEISTPQRGFDNFRVNWDGASGAKAILLGSAKFAPGSRHRLHRHTQADEGFYVLSGHGHHLTDEYGDVVASAGDYYWVPCNQWHAFTVDSGQSVETVWWYLGAATLDGTGYELREESSGISADTRSSLELT